MIRYLIYFVLFWFVWRLIRSTKIIFTKKNQQPFQQQQRRNGSFSNVQDAEFEDVTPKNEENK